MLKTVDLLEERNDGSKSSILLDTSEVKTLAISVEIDKYQVLPDLEMLHMD